MPSSTTQRMRRLSLLGLMVSLGACGSTQAPISDAPIPGARNNIPPLASVIVLPPELQRGSRRGDRVSLALALMELGLADLPGVVPRIGSAEVSSAFADGLEPEEHWTLALAVDEEGTNLRGELCGPIEVCATVGGTMESAAEPGLAVTSLLEGVASVMERTAAPGVSESWARLGSNDDYAVLMAGRSAAVFYGLRDPPRVAGDKHSDPVARAYYLDPALVISAWMAVRGERAEPVMALRKAVITRPESAMLRAELAGRLSAKSARSYYTELAQDAPLDPRFFLSVAKNQLALGDAKEASRTVNRLGKKARTQAPVAALRVAIADALGNADLSKLLHRWRLADRENPEPVRRLVAIRIANGDYQGALDLVPELGERGAQAESDELGLALMVAVGMRDEAAAEADRLKLPALAAQLREPEQAAPRRKVSFPRIR